MISLKTIVGRCCIAFTLLLAAAGTSAAESKDADNVAFFYGINPPVNALSQFDRLILESENITPSELADLKQHGSATYAYLSIGEVNPQRSWAGSIQPDWTMGVNTTWNSTVMDMTSSGWQSFVLQRVSSLVASGYDGLFLDTMDSYQLSSKDERSREAQQAALANLLQRIKQQHPSIRLISNRGFEVMDKVGVYLEAVAAESLFSGWNNNEGIYQEVTQQDRQWLSNKLTEIKQRHKVDIIAIDYVAPADRSTARDVAQKITDLGFTPWVANPGLDYVGVSSLEVIPREVIMLYDSRSNGTLDEAEVHTLLATPLEYMGYVPVYHDIAAHGLPHNNLKGAYAGVVVWHREHVNHDQYSEWLSKQLDDGLPLAMFGSIGTPLTETFSEKLGLKPVNNVDAFSLRPSTHDSMIGFETTVPVRIDRFAMSLLNDDVRNTSHLQFTDRYGLNIDTVLTGPWGGLAVFPSILDISPDGSRSWIIDPFRFLKTSLQLPDAPMPDITTENGTRLWFAHIDGDAMPSWAELPGRRLGSEVIRDEIIKRYKLPHTISVVEAEMYTPDTRDGPGRRDRMQKAARDLFALDYVEIATHTFSHPFHWRSLRHGSSSGVDNLPVADYFYDLDREIGGSARYIDNQLAPPDKKTKVMLWSGDAVPPAEAFSIADRYNLLNMNGGNTTITRTNPTVSAISPNARTIDGWTQVYAPIMNENVFTNEWRGPFDGFRRVIETLEMTDHPRRMKPMNVYYHFYAGTKKASLRSLEEIYDWSLQQEILPVVASEYIVKVPHFRSAGVARYLDGRWKVSGLGPIRSLRTLKNNSWPDLASSQHLIGTKKSHDATYIHTNGENTITFRMKSTRPQSPHLVSANAKINHWNRGESNTISTSLTGALPIVIELNGDKTYCQMSAAGKTVSGQLTPQGNTRFNLTTKETGDAVIDCKT